MAGRGDEDSSAGSGRRRCAGDEAVASAGRVMKLLLDQHDIPEEALETDATTQYEVCITVEGDA